MEFIVDFVEGFGLIEAVVTAFLAFLGYAGKKAYPFIKDSLQSLKKETNSDIIAWIAEEAVELMEVRFEGSGGANKFEEATAWLAERAKEYEIPIKEEEIRGAIQKGFNLTVKQEQKESRGHSQ